MKKNRIAILLTGILVFSSLNSGLKATATTINARGNLLQLKGIHYDQEGFSSPTSTKGKIVDVPGGLEIQYQAISTSWEEVTGVELRRNGEVLGFLLGPIGEYVDTNVDKSKNNKYEIIPISRRNLRVGTSLILESRPEVIKHYIDVNGVNPQGTKQVTVMRINVDYTDNTMYLTNRNGERVHAGLGIKKYFEFTLYDKNMKQKKDLTMYANDRAGYIKFNAFNLTHFQLGDYVEVFHEEPNRLTVDGEKATAKKTLYKITENGLIAVVNLDGTTINLGGSGKGSFDLEFANKVLTVKNKTKGSFASEYTGFSKYYIQVNLSDKNGKTKAQSNLYGSMYAQNIEVDKLNNVGYEYGDIITITHMAPEHINIKGAVIGSQSHESVQSYEITKEGLKAIS